MFNVSALLLDDPLLKVLLQTLVSSHPTSNDGIDKVEVGREVT